MNNNNNSNWVQDPSLHEKTKLPSGRTIRGVKLDAKKYKKEHGLHHVDALKIISKKNGLNCMWNDFVLRAKEFIGISSPLIDEKKQPYSHQTIIMGDSGVGRDRIALQQLASNIIHNPKSNDWIIDAKGDNIILWTLASIASKYSSDKELKVIDYVNGGNPASCTQLFNLVELNKNEIIYVINSLFDNKRDREIIIGIISKIDSSKPFHDLVIKIKNIPVSLLSSERKTKIVAILQMAIELNIFDNIGTKDERAWSSEHLFSENAMNYVSIPCLERNFDGLKFLLKFHINLIEQKIENSSEKFRITLIGLNGEDNRVSEFIKKMQNNPNVELILSTGYTSLSRSNNISSYNQFLKTFDKAICLRTHDTIPEHIKCLESTLRTLNLGDAIVLKEGCVNADVAKMPLFDFPELKVLKLFHANGKSLSNSD